MDTKSKMYGDFGVDGLGTEIRVSRIIGNENAAP